MPNYNNSKIYLIKSPHTDKVYVGSTTQKYLSNRFARHRCMFKKWQEKNTVRTCTSCHILAYGDAYIELYEYYPCKSKEELHKREGEIIREVDAINRCVAGRTWKQWYNDNREYRKQYLEANKDKFKQKQKEWVENNKDHVKKVRKAYKEKNKELIKQKNKEYREKNKDKIKANAEKNKAKKREYDRLRYLRRKQKLAKKL